MKKTRSDKKTRIGKLVALMRDEEKLTFKEIGKQLGFSKQRAHQYYEEYTPNPRPENPRYYELPK